MTISIWRYSHLTLAISSFVFIIIASVTGIVLAFEPISNQLKPFAIQNANTITLAETITSLKKEYEEVVSLKVDENNFLEASVITKNGQSHTFYVNPVTGKKIGDLIERASIYKWTTNLHRSLFLKSTGRFLVGFFSFLLFLITITGSILIIKRQGGIIQFFTKVVKEDFKQYYHVILGRYTLIPIIIITLTGVFLSLEKFSVLPETKISHNVDFSKTFAGKKLSFEDFDTFKSIYLKELKSLEFPFSDDEEDYFFLKLNNKELYIHQYSGEIISEQNLPWIRIVSNWSLFLHTGRGTILWSLILMFSSFSILFFVYSGFAMTIERRKKSTLPKNKINKDKAEFIILVGSETGSTFGFSIALYKALINAKKSVFIDHLNNYTSYKSANHLIVLTATYGEGDPPNNATNFLKLASKIEQPNLINYSVVGFGSMAYSDYCQFAIEVDAILNEHSKYKPVLPLFKINNQSFTDFKEWCIQWSKQIEIPLHLKQEVIKPKKQHAFTVVNKTDLNIDASFLVRLKPAKKLKFISGDLLSITPKEDTIERLYSIGKINNDILLSIKKHEYGICSNYLNQLQKNDMLNATITPNTSFHFPKKSTGVILIANGTGIAPFLGMIDANYKYIKTHLFWGGRTTESVELYSKQIYKAYDNKQLSSIHIAYSQEQKEKIYVQDLVSKEQDIIASVLKNNGTIMICGSIAMMNDVLKVLETISISKLNTPLNLQQIKTDCY
ncbi:sulfite reductase (NADPH) flavoprotein alpha-component [Tenacibaculum adriaticum]|uniref:NADPH--hemoprotein reductase n=1 Tax=Tenacibaculum adriaticum TaxID=413713 RepID=A0A5S5DXA8_9FLAO|nr:PepSY domain-containing protein [Tenacibaculum adriaticum]TYP99249.1 sulfite reductase (NADPH) flavoprotein alpha-component [Tenacibaculum adriaticum]